MKVGRGARAGTLTLRCLEASRRACCGLFLEASAFPQGFGASWGTWASRWWEGGLLPLLLPACSAPAPPPVWSFCDVRQELLVLTVAEGKT